jgi:hypothetical protein
MFNDCEVNAVTATGQTFTIEDWRFGRAPTRRVVLLERATVPPSYSTSVSLATIQQRLYLLACEMLFSILFLVSLIVYVFKSLRTRL